MEWLESLGLLGLFLGSALAASIVPFSSDVLYIAILATTGQNLGCFLAATSGSWLGSLFTFSLGWLGKWEWIEKWFKVTREKLEQQQEKVQKYGVWLALFSWVPIVGDLTVLALGFYRAPRGWTFLMLLIGKAIRYLFWNVIVGLF
ncbi:MAG: DedA family protein [Bacteroidales bacterium]|jgi:membrane protein YqaA with SNARE-associated domain|nr:DedA family protein [Bacteroidales bacterium]MBO6237916.1 DedA family protein [Bacteroidales bacterium]MDO4999561.1 DedA family protein [Bacteroidales bacterium]